jgi:hypothetical protein
VRECQRRSHLLLLHHEAFFIVGKLVLNDIYEVLEEAAVGMGTELSEVAMKWKGCLSVIRICCFSL